MTCSFDASKRWRHLARVSTRAGGACSGSARATPAEARRRSPHFPQAAARLQATATQGPGSSPSTIGSPWWLGGGVLCAALRRGYLHLLNLSGHVVGFIVCWYRRLPRGFYGTVVAIANPRHIVVERLVAATLYLVAALVIFALASTVVYTFVEGWPAFRHLNFFTHDMAGVSTAAPLSQGGILHAIAGTLIMVGIAVVVAVPLGIGTAVYMTEVNGPGSHLIRTVVEAMTALSDILAGLFVYALLVVGFGLGKTGLAAAIAIAVTMLPLVARASEVALRIVPGSLRQASEALGATHWKTTWKGRTFRAPVLDWCDGGHPRHRPGHRRDRCGPCHDGGHELLQRQSGLGAHDVPSPLHLHGV